MAGSWASGTPGKSRGRRGLAAEINVTPLVDVMLVLLIVFMITAPLLTTSDGKKMGKTADGAVWLNEELLPPFDYWQVRRVCVGCMHV